MSEIKIRQTIPNLWAERGRCPYCAASAMRVYHPECGPDQLQCKACGLAFEMEQEGISLHVRRWPDSLPFLYLIVPDEWVLAAGLRTLIQQKANPSNANSSSTPNLSTLPPAPTSTTLPAAAPMPPDAASATASSPKSIPTAIDEAGILERIRQLHALGNTPKEIKAILLSTEREPERIQAILKILAQVEHREHVRQMGKLRLSLGILGVIILVMVAAGFFMVRIFQRQASGSLPPVEAENGSTQVTTLSPKSAVKLLNLDTPVVRRLPATPAVSGVKFLTCPRNAQNAADMFGGQASDWYSPPNTHGWVLIRKGQGTEITLPAGMTAAYLQLDNGLKVVNVVGPALMSGVYYLAVSCP